MSKDPWGTGGRDLSDDSLERILALRPGDPIISRKDIRNGNRLAGGNFQDLYPNEVYRVQELIITVSHQINITPEDVTVVNEPKEGYPTLKFKKSPEFNAREDIELFRLKVEGPGAEPNKCYPLGHFYI